MFIEPDLSCSNRHAQTRPSKQTVHRIGSEGLDKSSHDTGCRVWAMPNETRREVLLCVRLRGASLARLRS
jgi:hypothetical protein